MGIFQLPYVRKINKLHFFTYQIITFVFPTLNALKLANLLYSVLHNCLNVFELQESEASLARVLEELQLMKKQNDLLQHQLSESRRIITGLQEGNLKLLAENEALWKTLQQASNNQVCINISNTFWFWALDGCVIVF